MNPDHGLQPPDFVISTSELGVVVYPDKRAVGIQFVDPGGAQVFVAIPGQIIPLLAKSLSDLATNNPDVLEWSPPK